MKVLFNISIFFFCTCNIFSQTYELEMKNLSKQFSDGKIKENEFTQLCKDWGDILKTFNGYPELPFNEKSGEIEFNFVRSFKDIDKKTLYDRLMEWSAINFGSLSSVMHYTNFDNGKIIIKGWFEVFYKTDYLTFFLENKKESAAKVKCNFILIFTIKDEKLKINITGVDYSFLRLGYNAPNYYIPPSEIDRPISEFYPITNGESIEWKGRLNLLNQTNLKINSFINSLESFINNKSLDYDF